MTGSMDDKTSTSGYCTFISSNLVTSSTKKQAVLAGSSAETEDRAMAHEVCKFLWLKTLLKIWGWFSDRPMKLYCDNKATINITHNPVQHDRIISIEIDRHFTKEKLNNDLICMPLVKTEINLLKFLLGVL